MKKKFIIGLSALATLGAVAGGVTYAFLTDSDVTQNTFSIGDVNISLASDIGAEEIRLMPNNKDKIKANYRIQNDGADDAYVWLRVKVPSALEDGPGLAADNIIHWNYLGAYANGLHENPKYIQSAQDQGYYAPVTEEETWIHLNGTYNVKDEETGIEYNVYDLLYAGALKGGTQTTVGVSTIYMDERVDKIGAEWVLVENGEPTPIAFDFNQTATIKVEAHAIQASGFENVEEAYAEYNAQWPNGRPVVEEEE